MDHSEHMTAVTTYMPHGHCYLWEPSLVWTHVVSDTLIGLAYLSISITLYVLVRKIRLPFSGMFVAFGLFIMACGLTHFMEVWTLWHPDYWLAADLKVITALASIATAAWLFPLTPMILKFAENAKLTEVHRKRLELAYIELEQRVLDRTKDLAAANEAEKKARANAEALYETAKLASQLKDEFLATVSHELRTPLNVIMGYSDLLYEGALQENEYNHAISAIRRNASLQAQLINDLLDISTIVAGKIKLNMAPVDLKEVLVNSIESVRPAAASKKMEIIFHANQETFMAYGDPMRLQQIFWNLLSNAVKFTANNGRIEITMQRQDDRIHILVKDNGIGIDKEFLPYVFERFRQEDSTTTRIYGGLGLGLGIAKNLTEMHGGSIRVFSEGKGLGTTFTVELLPIESALHA